MDNENKEMMRKQKSLKAGRDVDKAKERIIMIKLEIMEIERIRKEKKMYDRVTGTCKNEIKANIIKWKLISLEKETLIWIKRGKTKKEDVQEDKAEERQRQVIAGKAKKDDPTEKIDEEERVKERIRLEDTKSGKDLKECRSTHVMAEDRKPEAGNWKQVTENRKLMDCHYVSIERTGNVVTFGQNEERLEESLKAGRRPRSNFRRFGIELTSWGSYAVNTEAQRESGGLGSQDANSLGCGTKEISTRGLESGKTAGENMEEHVSGVIGDQEFGLSKKEIDDGKRGILGLKDAGQAMAP